MPRDDVIERHRHTRIDPTGTRLRRSDMSPNGLLEASTLKWRAPGQHLVKHARLRIDVSRGCGRLVVESFGCHIVEAANLLAGHRQMGVALGLGDIEVQLVGEMAWCGNRVPDAL